MQVDLISSNTFTVVVGTSLLGLACGVVGTFAVLRKRALVGDALAHASLPGICIAFLIFHQKNFLLLILGALLIGLLSVFCINAIRQFTRTKEDAAIAIVLSSFFGLGVVLSRIIQSNPIGNKAGLDDFIFGKAASMIRQDLYVICVTSLVSLATVAALVKEFKILCFDANYGWSLGFPILRLDYLLMSLVALCTVVGLPAVGVVLVSALLIFPGVTARLWTDSFEWTIFLGGIIGMFAALLGSLLSAFPISFLSVEPPPLPTGPVIVLCCAAFYVFSSLFGAKRGIITSSTTKKVEHPHA